MSDLLGKALYNYYKKINKPLVTWTSYTEKDTLECEYFFRKYKDMPKIEQKALDLAKGKILDVGSGAGCHSLYLQNIKNYSVTSIDISKKSIEVSKLLGLKNTINQSFFDHNNCKYDSILFLMNGAGICGTLDRLKLLLNHSSKLLNNDGQILIDSSDLIYLFDKDSDGGIWVRGDKYYGELNYSISYENKIEKFPWLYVDYNKLEEIALKANLNCEKIINGENYDYLAKLTKVY